jgi:hypothetical protein
VINKVLRTSISSNSSAHRFSSSAASSFSNSKHRLHLHMQSGVPSLGTGGFIAADTGCARLKTFSREIVRADAASEGNKMLVNLGMDEEERPPSAREESAAPHCAVESDIPRLDAPRSEKGALS